MRYVACYIQRAARMVSIEADSIEEAEEKMRTAVIDNGVITLTIENDWDEDDEVVFLDNPSDYDIENATRLD